MKSLIPVFFLLLCHNISFAQKGVFDQVQSEEQVIDYLRTNYSAYQNLDSLEHWKYKRYKKHDKKTYQKTRRKLNIRHKNFWTGDFNNDGITDLMVFFPESHRVTAFFDTDTAKFKTSVLTGDEWYYGAHLFPTIIKRKNEQDLFVLHFSFLRDFYQVGRGINSDYVRFKKAFKKNIRHDTLAYANGGFYRAAIEKNIQVDSVFFMNPGVCEGHCEELNFKIDFHQKTGRGTSEFKEENGFYELRRRYEGEGKPYGKGKKIFYGNLSKNSIDTIEHYLNIGTFPGYKKVYVDGSSLCSSAMRITIYYNKGKQKTVFSYSKQSPPALRKVLNSFKYSTIWRDEE